VNTPQLEILPSTKVSQLLDAYPELEDVLVAMAPPFNQLKNPILRRSVAKIASLKQTAVVGGLDVRVMINDLRHRVGQDSLESEDAPLRDSYYGAAPAWFDDSCVAHRHDDRTTDSDSMAFTRVLKLLKDLEPRQVVELETSFLPAPAIDAARKKRLTTWSVQDGTDHYRTFFTNDKHTDPPQPE